MKLFSSVHTVTQAASDLEPVYNSSCRQSSAQKKKKKLPKNLKALHLDSESIPSVMKSATYPCYAHKCPRVRSSVLPGKERSDWELPNGFRAVRRPLLKAVQEEVLGQTIPISAR